MSVQNFNKSTTVTTFTMRIQQVYIRTVLAITHQWWYYMPFRVVYHTHCVFIILLYTHFRIGFVMMLVTTLTAMVYLLVCHSGLHWNTGEARECVAARLAPAS